jgi:hypothetical protein
MAAPPPGWMWSPWYTLDNTRYWVPRAEYHVMETPVRYNTASGVAGAWNSALNTVSNSSGPYAINHNVWADTRRANEPANSGWTNQVSPPWLYDDAPYSSGAAPYVRGENADVPPGWYDSYNFSRPDLTSYKMVGGFQGAVQYGFFGGWERTFVTQHADSTLIDLNPHYNEGSWSDLARTSYEQTIGVPPPYIYGGGGEGSEVTPYEWDNWGANFAVTGSKLRLFTHGIRAGGATWGDIQIWVHNDQSLNSLFPSHVGWSGTGANPNGAWAPEALICTLSGGFTDTSGLNGEAALGYYALAWRNNGPDNYGPVYGLNSLTVSGATVLLNDYDDKWLIPGPEWPGSPVFMYIPDRGGKVFVTELAVDIRPYIHGRFIKFQAFPTALYSSVSPDGSIEAGAEVGVNLFAIQPQPLLRTHFPRIRYLIPYVPVAEVGAPNMRVGFGRSTL